MMTLGQVELSAALHTMVNGVKVAYNLFRSLSKNVRVSYRGGGGLRVTPSEDLYFLKCFSAIHVAKFPFKFIFVSQFCLNNVIFNCAANRFEGNLVLQFRGFWFFPET